MSKVIIEREDGTYVLMNVPAGMSVVIPDGKEVAEVHSDSQWQKLQKNASNRAKLKKMIDIAIKKSPEKAPGKVKDV